MHNLRRVRITLVICCLLVLTLRAVTQAAEPPEYLKSFDPTKGFKPVQSDLTDVYLQIGGSLEYYGSPEPYLQHMKGEHARIEEKYQQQLGHASKSYWPAYMTGDYFDQFTANWNAMAPKLGLVAIARNTGKCMRDAINGTRGNSTMLVEIFNHHQLGVFDSLAGKNHPPSDFNALQKELILRLEIGQKVIHDEHYGIMQRDAVDFTTGILGPVDKLFIKLDVQLTPTNATQIKAAITSMFVDVGRVAQAELEEAIVENALDRQSAPTQVNAH